MFSANHRSHKALTAENTKDKRMTEKELRKLSRAELLELLLIQAKEAEQLRKRLERAEEKLCDRQLQVLEAGNLAQAALAINGVMEAAQAAADQYLANIARMEQEMKLKCQKLLADACGKTPENTVKTGAMDGEEQLLEEIHHLIDEDEENKE